MDSPPPSTTTTTTTSSSILSSIGVEIISILSPVSLCMLLVVLLISTVHPSSPDPTPIRTAATLVYLESPSDSTSQKLQGALLNAAAFVALIALVTFLLVLLYYYNFTSFLKHYMRFSAFFVFATMGGAIFLSVIQQFSLPIDSITCFAILFNFTAVGVLSVFSAGFPIVVRQGYMVSLGIIVAAWFSKLPEWTTWVLLIALAVYDLVAVLAPGGPLKLLVELASSRDEELPALIYEARPTVSREALHAPSSSPPHELLSRSGLMVGGASETLSVELQPLSHPNNVDYSMIEMEDAENSPLVVANADNSDAINEQQPLIRTRNSDFAVSGDSGIGTVHDEMLPLVEVMNLEVERARTGRDNEECEMSMSRGIKLGLGDFVFYSVLVGRAAMYDLMTVYACYLAIISGLGCTLILLSVCRRALPALPISIALGVMFYFLTRLLMEPFVVGASTNLVMF
ncbi:hypothetical protein MRB53_009519 [Persea americana]|uniref:Uncharacterized protein n=1 Tax=Persea americana TaxID=3435 RepID=A0ACC2LQA7_PERAE|nr:hypothetical protein MRB53_009519 [Persea americana]